MPRPCCKRIIECQPTSRFFKPAGIPLQSLDEITLQLDEVEALRLADLEGFYHEEAAREMGISRPTFGRILEEAHRKVALALIGGKAILIDGGNISIKGEKTMPMRDGTGPAGRTRGRGMGPCGGGQRFQGRGSGRGRGFRRLGMNPTGSFDPSSPTPPATEIKKDQGDPKS